MYYVYKLCDGGIPFYVGKGKGNRAWAHEGRAAKGHDGRVHRKIRAVWREGRQIEVVIVEHFEHEEDAFNAEKELIKGYRSMGIQLVNLTDGGDGTSGRITTDEQRENYRRSKVGHPVSDETRQKISEANRGRTAWNKGGTFSEVARQRMSESACGRTAWNKGGGKYSEETRRRMSESHKGKEPWNKGRKGGLR